MSSSCSNPFLYGWLNQNFRNEFEQIFGGLRKLFLRVCLNKKVPIVLQRRHSSDRTNGQQEQRFGDAGAHGDMTTMMPTNELMPYPLNSKNKNKNKSNNNNTEFTAMTDLRSCAAYCNDQQHQHSVLINFEPRKQAEKNGHVKARKKSKNQSGMGKLLTADPITNETRTTQLYLDTNFGVEGECTSSAYYQCSIDVPAVQQQRHHYRQNEQNAGHQQRNSHIAGSRFKRLSLTDSRKRKRKKCSVNGAGRKGGTAVGDQCPSVSAIATDHSSNSSSISLSMDKNNNSNSNGNDHRSGTSNGIVLSGGADSAAAQKAQLVVSVEQKGHAAHDFKRNDLTKTLLM